MCWKKIVFKQIQPIHLGKHKHGVINETRIFIPGKTIWGALVNSYALVNDIEFKEAKKKFTQISCFFPSFSKIEKNILYPKYVDGEFYLGDYSEKHFRYEFTDTIVSTAIDSQTLGAKDESLHETDFILQRDKKNQSQLYWVGIVKVENETKDFLKKDLEIKVGGERNYGYGKLKLIKLEEIVQEEVNKWKASKDSYNKIVLKNYLEFDRCFEFEGKLELLPEIDFFKEDKEIEKKKKNILYLKPGSKVLIERSGYKLTKGKLDKKEE